MGDHTGYELDGTPRAAGPLEVTPGARLNMVASWTCAADHRAHDPSPSNSGPCGPAAGQPSTHGYASARAVRLAVAHGPPVLAPRAPRLIPYRGGIKGGKRRA